MEPPKRLKLDTSASTSTAATSAYDPRRIVDAFKSFRTEPSKTHAELFLLKRHLDSKERVLAFLEYDNKSAYRAILSHLIGIENDIFMPQFEPSNTVRQDSTQTVNPQVVSTLREMFSVVANMCHLSVLACTEICCSNLLLDNLRRVFIRVLESKDQSLSTLRGPVLRLIGNLCKLKETAEFVVICDRLMHLVATTISRTSDGDDESADATIANAQREEEELALRVFRMLATRRKLLKYIIRCNGIAKIAAFIVRQHRSAESIFTGRPDLLQLLTDVLRVYPTQVGDQLTTSAECVELFFQFLLEHQKHEQQNAKLTRHLTELILRSVHSSHKMRYQLGQNAIMEILRLRYQFGQGQDVVTEILRSDQDTLSDVHCRFLCCFLKDIHGRAWLRESGGLDRILWRLATPEQCDNHMDLLRLQQFIMDNLKSILHDRALSLTINHPNFLPTVIAQINRFLDENLVECEAELPRQKQLSDSMEELNVDHAKETDEKTDSNRQNNDAAPLCKDFSASVNPWLLHSQAVSPPLIQAQVVWSPSMSPSTSSPNHDVQFLSSPSASPPTDPSQFWLDNYLEEGLGTKAMSPPLQDDMSLEELENDDPSSFLERRTIDEEDDSDTEVIAPLASSSGGDGDGGVAVTAADAVCADGQSSSVSDSCGKMMAERKKIGKIRAKIVDASLTLITTFSHLDERQSIVLINKNVMHALVRHVGEAPAMDNRLCRALRRLARHRMGLQKMFEIDFHMLVIRHLIRRQCPRLLNRFAPMCIRCDYRRDFGRRLLCDHAMLADSSMGEHLLFRVRLEGANEWERMRIFAAALVLFRRDEHRKRIQLIYHPIGVLLEFVARIVKETVATQSRLDEHSAEGRICCDILSALSALLKWHREYFEETFGSVETCASEETDANDTPGINADQNECKPSPEGVGPSVCVLQSTENSGQLTLKFIDKNGSLVAEVPKDELCTHNEYFMGMFGSEFLERLTGRDQFVFDAEAECCSREEFVKFLHFSIGCGLKSECVQVPTAECCVAMLRLADKYLCTRLLDHLLLSGKASRFITGNTLRLFFPLVLTVPTVCDKGGLMNICMIVLLRYCTDAQMLDVFRLLAERDTGVYLGSMEATTSSAATPFASALSLVDSLCEALRTFMRSFAELVPQRAVGKALLRESSLDMSAYWDFN